MPPWGKEWHNTQYSVQKLKPKERDFHYVGAEPWPWISWSDPFFLDSTLLSNSLPLLPQCHREMGNGSMDTSSYIVSAASSSSGGGLLKFLKKVYKTMWQLGGILPHWPCVCRVAAPTYAHFSVFELFTENSTQNTYNRGIYMFTVVMSAYMYRKKHTCIWICIVKCMHSADSAMRNLLL